MTLTIEDGTGIAAADSWLTLAEYDATLLALFDLTRSETDAATEAAIRRGSSYIGTLDLEGVRTYGRAQGTCLPRTGLTDADDISIAANEIPQEFKLALFHMSRAELTSPGALSPTVDQSTGGGGGQVKRVREKIGPLETETEYSVPTSSSSASAADASKSGTDLAIERSRVYVTAALDVLRPFLKAGASGAGFQAMALVV